MVVQLAERIQPYPLFREIVNPLFFPVNREWRWYPVRITNRTIAPGDTLTLWDEKGSGWLYYALARVDNPNVTLKADLQADGYLEIIMNIQELHDMGLVGLGQGTITVTKYDDVNNDYVVTFSPIGYGVPFRGKNRCVLYNPTTSSVTLKLFYGWLIILEEYE